ncbi:hypothetical protein J008_00881 [Cryptococcus neoformans]|uniref:Protein-vacuolar targeting-related protein n=2 Tax=Cryptococcus neoformans TaxID=5207 RepID=A0A854QL08_CRYNE|nr:hypothetical protein CNAG_06792 [Cryptococcus neoformans var. grubii H99]AUB22493.1 hypothetical protein CKF44_06792 [Cryptococcus neoformans var. grubii]OWT41606.1 hypothetical protein C362_00608 [Cryptococcus neoformans var. grubii Bt1]OWZ35622.1 hypothetical protein C347_00965 [Cryptococcus neoformans var. grubii AD2-60a]OWZ47540.1 hypothetical protein C343_00893 [Cryptococcus neoformans var. grubii C23]OWZ53860.1 hypothetical protein C353_00899 [Cryptococcus neoformans var. grubii AD1-8|eukprot:XP_012047736.1 hypothetical protein CNAG_06792 [Cryptococcus neoformans var. grubii H99]
MSIPHSAYDPRRVFRFNVPHFEIGPKARSVGTYLSGGLFALSYFLLFDAATLSSHAKPPPDAPYDVVPVHMAFVDWIPAICTTLGFIITSLLDKSHLTSAFSSDPWAHEGSAAWRARVVLFIGVALMAGGLAGSLCVLILKYIVPDYTGYTYYGAANVATNAGIMISAMILWISQSGSDEYEYQLTV